MPEHVDIQSSQCHEPKHITSATTADAGKVITPSSVSNGVSVFRKLDAADITGLEDVTDPQYCQAGVVAGATSVAITTSDTDVSSVFSSELSQGVDFDITSTNAFNIPVAGVYRASVSLEFDFGEDVVFSLYLNGSPSVRTYTASDHVSFTELATVTSNAVVKLYAKASSTGNPLTIVNGSFNLQLVEAT